MGSNWELWGAILAKAQCAYFDEDSSAYVDADALGVSDKTLERELNYLEYHGLIKKIPYTGALVLSRHRKFVPANPVPAGKQIKLTHQGRDYLSDDGGMSSIRLPSSDIRELRVALVDTVKNDEKLEASEKQKFVERIQNAVEGEVVQTCVKASTAGIGHALSWLCGKMF